MKSSIIINSLLLVFLIPINSFSQKIKSEGYTCALKEVTKEIIHTCGDANIVYKGTIVVKSKDKLAGTYPFYFSGMGNNLSLLTIKNQEMQPLSPTLIFEELKREFYFNKGKENELKIFIADEKTYDEVILEGMLFWLKIKKQKE